MTRMDYLVPRRPLGELFGPHPIEQIALRGYSFFLAVVWTSIWVSGVRGLRLSLVGVIDLAWGPFGPDSSNATVDP